MASTMESEAAPRALSAAEKRAARRARVLQGSEDRLKLVTGQISSLKDDGEATTVQRQLDAGIDELLRSEGGVAPAEMSVPTRVDPAQRRRDAALRRKKKEAAVEAMLGGADKDHARSDETESSPVAAKPEASAPTPKAKAEPAFSRHALALRLQVVQDKVVAFALLTAAVYIAMAVDLRSVLADLAVDDEIVRSYRELLARGIPLDAIKQRAERDHLLPADRDRLERVLFAQSHTAAEVSPADSLWPSVWDVSDFFQSLVEHPPILLAVFLVRVVVAAIARGLHVALALPDVKRPQEDDLGFVVNLALSSRPALKGYVIKLRKSVDDLGLFLFAFVLCVVARALWLA